MGRAVHRAVHRATAESVLKNFVRLASVFPSPPFRSSDFAGPRRSRLYGFHTGTRSLSNRKGRGRRSGGREREHRRAGEGRLVWNGNSCFLIDYRLWAAKSEGRPWVDQCLDHHLNLGVGCAPSCWPIFGFRTSWVLAGGAEGSFLCSPSSRFSGRGGGVGSLPRAWRRVGVPRRSRC